MTLTILQLAYWFHWADALKTTWEKKSIRFLKPQRVSVHIGLIEDFHIQDEPVESSLLSFRWDWLDGFQLDLFYLRLIMFLMKGIK